MKTYSPPVLGVDISKWQRVVGGNYEYPVFCARVHSGYSIDQNFAANARVIDANPGVKVKAAYIVPVAGMNLAWAVDQVMSVLPAGWCVMIDEESGAGFHGPGNHSAVNNDLRERFIARLGGNRRMVWGYANGGDWASGWPDRGDTPMVVAKYSASDNDLIRSDQCIGWQYSDGEAKWSVPNGYPRGSRAVGNCDMNVYGFPTGDAFAAWLSTGHTTDSGTATPITSEEDDMPLTDAEKAEIAKLSADATILQLRQQFAPSGELFGRVKQAVTAVLVNVFSGPGKVLFDRVRQAVGVTMDRREQAAQAQASADAAQATVDQG